MGQYLTSNIVEKITVSKEGEEVGDDKKIKDILSEELNLDKYYFTEDKDNYYWELKEGYLAGDKIRSFLEEQDYFLDEVGSCINSDKTMLIVAHGARTTTNLTDGNGNVFSASDLLTAMLHTNHCKYDLDILSCGTDGELQNFWSTIMKIPGGPIKSIKVVTGATNDDVSLNAICNSHTIGLSAT